jgi:hypothetical protein
MIFAGGVLFAAQRVGIGISGGSCSQFHGDGPLRREVRDGSRPCPGRVEDGRGSFGHLATLRFPSPLIEPDVPISGVNRRGVPTPIGKLNY